MEIKNFLSFENKEPSGFGTLLWVRTKAPQLASCRKTVFVAGIFFSIFLAIAICSANRMKSWADASDDYQVKLAGLSINQLPTWLTPHVREISPIGLPEQLSVYSQNLTQRIADSYRQNPWVEEVKEISKRYPNQVIVKLSLRQPVAWVRHSHRYFLSDVHAVRLPGNYPQPIHTANFLPVIAGVNELPAPGNRWQDPSLRIALELSVYLNSRGVFQSISVTRILLQSEPRSDDGEFAKNIVFISDDSIPIIWGKSFDSRFPRVTLQQRVNALMNFCRQSQTADVSRVDIRPGYAIVRTKD